MARVVTDLLSTGTTSTTTTDAIFTAISTQSTAVDEENVAEEGLDYRPLEDSIQSTRAFDAIEDTNGGTQALTTTFAAFNCGTNFTSGSITVQSDEVLIVEANVDLLSDGTQEGIPAGGDIEYKLQYNDGAWNDFASSFGIRLPPSDSGLGTASGNGRLHTMLYLAGPQTLTGGVRLVIRDSSGTDVTIQCYRAMMRGRIYKRH